MAVTSPPLELPMLLFVYYYSAALSFLPLFLYVGGGLMMKDLLPEMAVWEMHIGAKMVPFCCVFKVSGGSLPGCSLKLL